MNIKRFDHLVLTVSDVDRAVEFYTTVLDATAERFDGDRRAVSFGEWKINFHPADDVYTPHAAVTSPGTDDFCLVVTEPIDAVRERLEEHSVEIVHGPVKKTGAQGEMTSVYVRDPDENLVELARYDGNVD